MKHFIKNYWVLNVIFMVDKENCLFSRFFPKCCNKIIKNLEKKKGFLLSSSVEVWKIKNSGKLRYVIKKMITLVNNFIRNLIDKHLKD